MEVNVVTLKLTLSVEGAGSFSSSAFFIYFFYFLWGGVGLPKIWDFGILGLLGGVLGEEEKMRETCWINYFIIFMIINIM